MTRNNHTENRGGVIVAALSTMIMISLILSFVGCAGGYPRNPDAVVAEFINAAADGDFEKIESLMSEKHRESFNSVIWKEFEKIMKMESDSTSGSDVKITTDDLEYSIDGNTAKVWQKDFEFLRFEMVKEGGRWKVDDIDLDMSGMMKVIEDMGFSF